MENTAFILCESCCQLKEETILESNDVRWPYRLCLGCAHRLVMFSLRPLEWFHLAVIHGPHEYYLHDDFYSDVGEALQPRERVVEPQKWPLPALSQANLSLLIDYAIVRFNLDEYNPLWKEIRSHDSTLLLTELQKRLRVLPPSEIEGYLYIISAYTLGHEAETLIRNAWQHSQLGLFLGFILCLCFMFTV